MNLIDLKNKIDAKMLKCLVSGGLDDYYKKFLFNKAKRLRPLYAYLTADFLNFRPDNDILSLAVAIEFLHSATLIHDDILDDAKIRRGMDCLHLTKNTKTAVLAGDFLLSNAMELLSQIKNPEVFQIVSNSCMTMVKSEIDTLLSRYIKPELSVYLKHSTEKTAPLFSAAARGVFVIANTPIDENFMEFTKNFALCFQLKDDLNNALGTEENKLSNDKSSGVYTLIDILENKNSCDKIKTANDFLNEKIEKTKKLLCIYPKEKVLKFKPLFKLIEG